MFVPNTNAVYILRPPISLWVSIWESAKRAGKGIPVPALHWRPMWGNSLWIALSAICWRTSRFWKLCPVIHYFSPWRRQYCKRVRRSTLIAVCRSGIAVESEWGELSGRRATIDLLESGFLFFYIWWNVEICKALASNNIRTKWCRCAERGFKREIIDAETVLGSSRPVLEKKNIVEILWKQVKLVYNQDGTVHRRHNGWRAVCHPVKSKWFENIEAAAVRRVMCPGSLKAY